MKNQSHKRYTGLAFILPWIIGFLVFQLYPFAMSLLYSFTNFTMLKDMRFIGLENYRSLLLGDRYFMASVSATFTYMLIAVPGKLIFALIIAMLLNMRMKGQSIYRTAYYLPSILGGSVSIAALWRYLFNRQGTINLLLGKLGGKPVDWLGNPSIAPLTIGLLSIWQFGSPMLLFLAGLKQIPEELYEVSRVDGAGKVRTFFAITLPLLSPILFFNFIMQMIMASQEFTAPFIITDGGPLNATYLYSMMIYKNGFQYLKMGYASAMSWIWFLLMLALTVLVFKSSVYWTYYEDGGVLS